MATTLRDLEPAETECSVCQNNFVNPKILPCGHLFCRDCIVSLINSRNQPNCPLCRHPFVDPTEMAAISPDYIADTLPTDYALRALAVSVDLLAKEPLCCVCDGVRAESICVECQDMLCSACTTAHKKLSATRSHDVENLRTITPTRLAASCPALCADHGEKQSLFCSNHGRAVCASCVVARHRSCQEVKDLDSQIKSAHEAMKGLTDKLTDAEEKMEQTISKSLKESTTCKTMASICDNLSKIYRKQKIASRKSLDARNSVMDAIAKLRTRLATVKSHKRIVARARTVSPRPEMIYAKSVLQQRIGTMDLTAALPAEVSSATQPLKAQHYELIQQIRSGLRLLEYQTETPEELQFAFHRNRGDGILLSEDGKLATRNGPGGVLVSSHPMEPRVLYEIKVLEKDRDWHPDDIQFCGVTGTHPNDLNVKPSIVEMGDVSTCLPEITNNARGDAKGIDSVWLIIDSISKLHVLVNEETAHKLVENVPRPCYAVFDLGINVKKIRALKPRVVRGPK